MILNHYSLNTNHRKMCHGPTQFNGHLALCFPDELLCKRSRGVLLNQKTTALPCQPYRCLPEAALHTQSEPQHCREASAHLASQPGVPFSTAPGHIPGSSVRVLQEPDCAQLIFSPRPAFMSWKGHCKVPVADLVNLSPVTLQPLSLISSKDSTRTVMEHGGKPATLKPRAAKSHANEGWQAPACG